MKKLMMAILVTTAFVSCKKEAKKEIQPETTVEAIKTEPLIDYASVGMDTTSIPKGLNVGDNAPEITFTTADNKKETLASYYEKQPVVIIFYRGYWCPVCNKHLTEFAQKAEQIEAAGAKLIAVSSESYDNVAKTKEQTGANFIIISDSDGSIRNAFDVNYKVTEDYHAMIQDKLKASIAETNANKQAELPVPATFIIDKTGKIVYKQFNPDYKVRATVDDILNNLPK
nr:peroxiredoxin-like family protein [uncultured Flavobacterium sp.]